MLMQAKSRDDSEIDDWEPDPAWPITAIPQRWIERLFGTMSAFYGARFADLWRGSKVAEVKRAWGIEIAKLSAEQMRAGRENLAALAKPPTLPEFMAHCRQARTEQVAHSAPQLADERRADQATVEANLSRMREAQRPLLQARAVTAEWAYRVLIRGASASGKPLTSGVMRCITDAITSPAGRSVIEECADPTLREEYRVIRDIIVDNYRAQGLRLWSVA
ncbi:hypothetical protein [Burkholderia ubonensis]|uniref:hypothetical protein n=1 Tax=Burkholderia ubonensis TaxID=101571 RepID=UPI001E558DBE|nr:hypothetical protein [Burkholderia ubonensis]